MKAEPESRLEKGHDIKFSIDDLAAKKEPEPWDGKPPSIARTTVLTSLQASGTTRVLTTQLQASNTGVRADICIARNNLRAMKEGDLAFFYHSSCKVPAIVGTMEIVQEHTPDRTSPSLPFPILFPSQVS